MSAVLHCRPTLSNPQSVGLGPQAGAGPVFAPEAGAGSRVEDGPGAGVEAGQRDEAWGRAEAGAG